MAVKPKTVDEYINAAPIVAQNNLRELRAILKKAVPVATESIKWGAPVLEHGRILFAYRAHKAHINFIPTRSAIKPFASELDSYKTGRDSIQFPHALPIPKALTKKIATLRVRQVVTEGSLWRQSTRRKAASK